MMVVKLAIMLLKIGKPVGMSIDSMTIATLFNMLRMPIQKSKPDTTSNYIQQVAPSQHHLISITQLPGVYRKPVDLMLRKC